MKTVINNIQFPEGPAFNSKGEVWIVEKDGGNLISYNKKEFIRFNVGGNPNGIAIDERDSVWFCDSKNNSIRIFHPKKNETEIIINNIDGIPLKMPNDLCFDPSGNLLFTCPGDDLTDGTGYLCCYTKTGVSKRIFLNMYYCNGLAFDLDKTTLYVAETGTKWIWRMSWCSKSLSIKNAERFIYVGGKVGPDGIALDDKGLLFVALYGSGRIIVIDPSKKEIIKNILLEGKNPTNCAIDPVGKQGLFITEAEKGELIQWDYKHQGIIFPSKQGVI